MTTPPTTGILDWPEGTGYAAFTANGETTPLLIIAAAEGLVLDARPLSTLVVGRDGEYRHHLLELRPLATPYTYEAIERVRW